MKKITISFSVDQMKKIFLFLLALITTVLCITQGVKVWNGDNTVFRFDIPYQSFNRYLCAVSLFMYATYFLFSSVDFLKILPEEKEYIFQKIWKIVKILCLICMIYIIYLRFS